MTLILPEMTNLYVIASDPETITMIQGVGIALREPLGDAPTTSVHLSLPDACRPYRVSVTRATWGAVSRCLR